MSDFNPGNVVASDHTTKGSQSIQAHDGHLSVIGYNEAIGHGVHSDINLEHAQGRKIGIGVGAYTILESAAFVQPSADTQMYIQSSSANDSSNGTGIQQITIEYFSSAWGTKKSTIVTTNGINQVAVSVADIYRIHKMYANRVGSLGVADGLIKLTDITQATLYGQISQYQGFMQRCVLYVGNGRKITITEALISSFTSQGVIGRIFASEEDASGNVVPRARILFEIASDSTYLPFILSESVPNPNNKRIAVGIAITGNAANQSCAGSIKGFEEEI